MIFLILLNNLYLNLNCISIETFFHDHYISTHSLLNSTFHSESIFCLSHINLMNQNYQQSSHMIKIHIISESLNHLLVHG